MTSGIPVRGLIQQTVELLVPKSMLIVFFITLHVFQTLQNPAPLY